MKNILFLIFLVGLASCKDAKKTNYNSPTELIESTTDLTVMQHPGKKLMETNCYVCHSPTAPEKEGRVGPPMIAIKAHYINDQTTKEEFTEAMWSFVENPSAEKAKLRGAVKRFGVMPYQPFKEEEIAQIADYVFEYQIDEPDWFKEHWENGRKKKREPYKNGGKKVVESKNQTSAERGLDYAMNTKKELGKNLMGTIQKKGTKEAVNFCNKQAYPITDSVAVAQNAFIRRVSDKPRNPENQANTKELAIIARFKKAIANNEDYQPVTEVANGKVTFYAPITTNSMCLQCHGTPNTTIQPEVLQTIASLYPEDKAIGYDVNEVRGIWSIYFEEN